MADDQSFVKEPVPGAVTPTAGTMLRGGRTTAVYGLADAIGVVENMHKLDHGECSLQRFRTWLTELVSQIPRGSVAAYGSVAAALGEVRAARAVAEELRHIAPSAPVHRVVDRRGTPRLGAAQLLAREGVMLVNGCVELPIPWFDEFETMYPLHGLRSEQQVLASRVVLEGPRTWDTVTGVDVAYAGDQAVGAAVTMADSGAVTEQQVVWAAPGLPYIPTFLGFRELPVIRELVGVLRTPPCALMVDGGGILHPGGLGSASHIGVVLGIPSIGVTKRLLCGEIHGGGCDAEVWYGGRHAGWAMRASEMILNPVYVSPGHLLGIDAARQIVRQFLMHRIPEPIRRADALARNAAKRGMRRADQ